jgi:hypothetical protein
MQDMIVSLQQCVLTSFRPVTRQSLLAILGKTAATPTLIPITMRYAQQHATNQLRVMLGRPRTKEKLQRQILVRQQH